MNAATKVQLALSAEISSALGCGHVKYRTILSGKKDDGLLCRF